MWLVAAAICLIQQTTPSEEIGRHLNPQGFMTIPEIIQFWGYPSKQYEVQTDDGYFLQLNRIPYGLHSPEKNGHNPAVLLVPGILADSRCWIANLPSNSIGFVLADAGYDVWLLNNRGTTWSRRHQNLSIEQEEFWDFSFHEMGIYDIPATMKFILMQTKQEALYYIGHSQGASMGMIAFSLFPELAKKVKLLMSFSPAYTMLGIGGLVKLIFVPDILKRIIMGKKEFCIISRKMKLANVKLCSHEIIDKICVHILSMIVGWNEKNQNTSRIDVVAGIFPDYTSVKTVIHWSQVARSGEFKYFDYGSKNQAVYNMTTPPFYKVEDMTVPTAVWSAGRDKIETVKDVQLLLPRITHLTFYKNIPDWNHSDYLLGLDDPKYLYPDIFALMEHYK
ncbi:lysosomal acid lipase/cholesteryl ester hydrolase-like isoform X2 [Paroedura picta]|uniref:lysosomal acid lipase/cholesteryl ester hydrolase-like isoform X2 n=1 Tax=Paroedura picta TaxID=143630 RepID=UPI0040564701